jgi:Flp pilus assembly protein TadD
VGTIFGERLLYMPSVAVCLLAGAGLGWLAARYRAEGVPLVGAIVLILSLHTLHYSSAWDNDISLFRWATAAVPGSTKAHHKLGEELLRAGDLGGSLRSLNRSLDIAPDNVFASQTLAVARRRIADRYLPPEGRAAAIPPPPTDPEVLYALGQMSWERGDVTLAEEYWESALAADSNHPESLGDLGVLRLMDADTTTAFDYLQKAVRGNPRLASAWFALARIHLSRDERTEATRALRHFIDSAGQRHPGQVEWARGVLSDLGGL